MEAGRDLESPPCQLQVDGYTSMTVPAHAAGRSPRNSRATGAEPGPH